MRVIALFLFLSILFLGTSCVHKLENIEMSSPLLWYWYWREYPESCNVQTAEKVERIEKKLQAKVEDYLSRHPDTPERIKESLQSFYIVRGMTKEQVLVLYGDPPKVIKSDEPGITECWIYGARCGYYEEDRICFDQDRVVRISNYGTGDVL